MSLSYADVLLKDPAHLFELLYSKYGNIDEDLEQLYINQVVYNKKTHYDTLYKEYQFTDILEEFLRRYYKSNESFPRIPKLAKYYKNYHLFFCKPVFCEWRINLIMSKYGDTKAEIYYKDNYGNDSKLKNDNEQNIESSSSESSEINDNKHTQNVNKTIFDKNTRKFIDNNNNVKNKMNSKQPNESLVLNICDDSKLNQTLGLISRRSNNTSFIDLMKTLSVKVNTPSSIKCTKNNNRNNVNSVNTNNINSIQINNNRNSGLVGSLCSLTKRIPDLPNSNTKTTNRFLISPKIKMYLNNGKTKTKLSEFHYNNPINLNNINKQKQLIPLINASSNTSNNNNNNNYNINIVVPFHQKNKSYQQNSIGTNNNNNNSINNFFHNHKSTRLTRNNSKKLSYNLSLKKNSFQSNPISNVHSLSNNNNNNKTTNRKTKLNIIKSPQHSSVNNYFNMVFNLTHNNKKELHHRKQSNTKTFFVQQSQRSNSYKTNSNNNNNRHLVNNNRNSRNQNFIKTNTQSVKSLSKTKTIFTRSVDDKDAQRAIINKGNAILNSNNQVNAMINILYKHHQQHVHVGSEEKKHSNNKHFHIFNHVSSRSNNLQEGNGKESKMKHSKGGMMLKTLNGFNVGSNNKLRIMQNKKMK